MSLVSFDRPAAVLLAAVLGLAAGGFVNAAIRRLPRGASRAGRSRWRDLVVDAACGLLAAALYLRFGGWRPAAAYGFLAAVLLAAACIDLEHRIIPNRLVLAGLAGGAVLAPLWGGVPLVQVATGFLLAGGGMLAIALLGRGGMGMGDVKLAAVIGLFLGPALAAVALVVAFWVAGLISALLLILRRRGRKDMIPFGPFLGVGGLAAVFFGQSWLAWLMGGR